MEKNTTFFKMSKNDFYKQKWELKIYIFYIFFAKIFTLFVKLFKAVVNLLISLLL